MLTCWIVLAIFSCAHDPFGLLSETIDWSSRESEHFIYNYQSDLPEDVLWHNSLTLFDGSIFNPAGKSEVEVIDTYLEHWENWYDFFEQITGSAPSQKINIYKYRDLKQHETYGNSQAKSFIDYQKMNGKGLAIHMYRYPTVGHELYHIFQSQIGMAPLFLFEGSAVALASFIWIPHEYDDLVTFVDVPSLAVANYPQPVIPYNQELVEEGDFWFPLHKIAAMKLGLYKDEHYHLRPGKLHRGLRPSQIKSWVNVFTKDQDITYSITGSFCHYLIDQYGIQKFFKLYKKTNASSLSGTQMDKVFQTVYKIFLNFFLNTQFRF